MERRRRRRTPPLRHIPRPLRATFVMLALLLASSVASLPPYLRAAPSASSSVLLTESFATALAPGTWTITDSQNKLATNAAGFLSLAPKSPAAWGDPGIVGPAFGRAAGRALSVNVLPRNAVLSGPLVRWAASDAAPNPATDGQGLYVQNSQVRVVRSGKPPLALTGLSSIANTETVYTIVQRPQGAYYFVSGLPGSGYAVWPQATLVWVDRAGNDGTLRPAIANHSQEAQVRDLRVADLDGAFADASGLGLATAADAFDRSDGLLGTADAGGLWESPASWTVSGNRAVNTATAGSQVALLASGGSDGLVEATLRTPASGRIQAGVVVRASDGQNYLSVRLRHDPAVPSQSNRVQLVRTQNGADTYLGTGTVAISPSADYRIVVQLSGADIMVYVNDVAVWGAPVQVAFNQTAPGAGLYRAGAAALDGGASFDDFAAWPTAATLPAEAGPGPYATVSATSAVYYDALGSGALASGWNASGGNWSPADGALRMTGGQTAGNVLLRAASLPDVDAAVDLQLDAVDGAVNAGLVVRALDARNNIFLRVLHNAGMSGYSLHLGYSIAGSKSIIGYLPLQGEAAPGQTLRLRLVAEGTWITAIVNGRPRISWQQMITSPGALAGLYAGGPEGGASGWKDWELRGPVTGAVPNVLLSESFSGPLNPAVWTETDPQNKMTVNADGYLQMTGESPANWQQPRLVGPSFARTPGRALVAHVIHRMVGARGPLVRWAADEAAADPRQDGHGLLAQLNMLNIGLAGRPPLALQGAAPSTAPLAWGMTNTEYIYTIVQRPQGAFYFVSNLPDGTHAPAPAATLVWVDRTGAAPSLRPVVSDFSAEAQVRDLRVVDLGGAFADLNGTALAKVADSFTRVNGPLGAAEVGGTWTAPPGWSINGDRAVSTATGSVNAAALTTSPGNSGDGMYEVTLRTPAAGPLQAGLVLRATDASNYLSVRLRHDVNATGQQDRLLFVRTENGVETYLGQHTLPIAPATDYRILAILKGASITVFVNDQQAFGQAITNTFNQTAAGAGLYRAPTTALDAGTSFDDFAVWPTTVALPAAASPGFYGEERATHAVTSSTFVSPASLTGWTQENGSWGIENNRLRVLADGTGIYNRLVKDLGTADGEVSATVTLPSADGFWLGGLMFRYGSNGNHMIARFFHIPNDNTIEVELAETVNGNGHIPRFFPIKFGSWPGLVEQGGTATLTVAAKGPWITIHVNDMPVIEYYSTANMTNTGWGLYTDTTDDGITFSDFTFESFSPLAAPTTNIQLNETFTAPLNAATWMVNDTQSKLSTDPTGFLSLLPSSPNIWGDPGIMGPSFARAAGRALSVNVLPRDAGLAGPLARWSESSNAGPNDIPRDGYGIYAQSGGLRVVRPNKTALPLAGLPAVPATESIYTIVQRPQGAYYFVSGQPGSGYAVWPQASLVWVDRSGSGASFRPAVANHSQTAQVRDLRVVDFTGAFADSSGVGLATAADAFSRSNGPLGTATAGGAWTATAGWSIVEGRAVNTAATGTATAILDQGTGGGDGIIEATVRTAASGPVQAGLIFRATDSQNYLALRLRHDPAAPSQQHMAQLVQTENGATTLLRRSTITIAPSTEYRIVAVLNGPSITVYINDTLMFSGPLTVAFNQTATGGGLVRAAAALDGGTTFDEIAVWPTTLTLPAEAGPGPSAPVAAPNAAGQDALTSDPLANGWSATAGAWTPNGSKLQLVGGQNGANLLLRPDALADVDLSVDLVLDSADGPVSGGIALRAQDQRNYIAVRLLHNPGETGPFRLQISQAVAGTTSIPRSLTLPGEAALGQTVNLRVVARGPWVTVMVNGKPAVTWWQPIANPGDKAGLYAGAAGSGALGWSNWRVRTFP